ncbi:MAG: hypothetical protein WCK89_15045 [bacterium]
MATETPRPQQTPTPSITAERTLVLRTMLSMGQLNDQTLPEDKGRIFMTSPFSAWPPEMQEALRPFGAEMIT